MSRKVVSNKKMENAPIYYALSQAQFNPINAMAKYIDEIQDLLRLKGYTLFGTQKNAQLKFDISAKTPSTVEVVELLTWSFTKPDRSAGFILSSSFLTYHTTNYDTRNEFLPPLLVGLKAVHEVVQIEHLSRLGLRYLNAVLPSEGENVDEYLVDGVRGMHFGAKQRYALCESVFDTDTEPLLSQGTLVNRVHRVSKPLGYPPDIAPNDLIPLEHFKIDQEIPHAVIDTDHFIEGFMPLDFNKIEHQLVSLHASVKQAFEATTTDRARTIWDSPGKKGA